jgi:thiamine monophosphate synthase
VPAGTPLVTIGGVGLDTAPAVVAAGADAVAVISALGGGGRGAAGERS